jgi:hypothetical protein
MSPACAAAQSSSAVLPTPASPRSIRTPLSPSRTAASTPSSAPVSTARSSNALIALPSSAPGRNEQSWPRAVPLENPVVWRLLQDGTRHPSAPVSDDPNRNVKNDQRAGHVRAAPRRSPCTAAGAPGAPRNRNPRAAGPASPSRTRPRTPPASPVAGEDQPQHRLRARCRKLCSRRSAQAAACPAVTRRSRGPVPSLHAGPEWLPGGVRAGGLMRTGRLVCSRSALWQSPCQRRAFIPQGGLAPGPG